MNAPLDTGRISIRPAVPSDLATLVEFRLAMLVDIFGQQTGLGPDPATLRAANERWFGEHLGRDFITWMAELDGIPAACAGLIWYEHPPGPLNPSGLEAYVVDVYTRPEARRLGLARTLVERLLEAARAAGAGRIWLRASDDGRPLYEALGFVTGNYMQLSADHEQGRRPGVGEEAPS